MKIYVLYLRIHSRESGQVWEPLMSNAVWFFKHYFTALRILWKTRQVCTAPPHFPASWERIRTSKPIETENGSKFMGTWIWTADKHFYEFVILKCPLKDNVKHLNFWKDESNDDFDESKCPDGARV